MTDWSAVAASLRAAAKALDDAADGIAAVQPSPPPPPTQSPPPPPPASPPPPPPASPPPPPPPPPTTSKIIPEAKLPTVTLGTVVDPTVTVGTVSVDPLATTAWVEISLSSPPTTTAIIDVATQNGSAIEGYHFKATRKLVVFAAGGPAKQYVPIPLMPKAANLGLDFSLIMLQQQNPGCAAGAKKAKITFAAGGQKAAPEAVAPQPPARTPQKGALTWQFDPATFKASDAGGPGVFRSRFSFGRDQSGNNELGLYTDPVLYPGTHPFEVRNGVLVLRAEKLASPITYNGKSFSYGASVLEAAWLSQKYGYYEVEAQTSSARGTWSAFWLLASNGAWPPEIDVFEHPRNGQITGTITTVANHWLTDGTFGPVGTHASIGATLDTHIDLTAGFHTYGVDWREDYTTYYIDGVEIFTTPTRFHQEAFPLLDVAVGGWGGTPDFSTGSTEMLVRALRVYA